MNEQNGLLNELFPSTLATPSGDPEKRPVGRPAGSTSPVLARSTFLHLEDFFFLRSVINGLDAGQSYLRYYGHLFSDAQGRITTPHASTLLANAKKLIDEIAQQANARETDDMKRLVSQLQAPLTQISASKKTQEQSALSFEQWAETVPDMYMEKDMPDMYLEYLQVRKIPISKEEGSATQEMVQRSNAIQTKVRALNSLQTELARRPVPEHAVNLWFAPNLASALDARNLHNLLTLVRFIGREGRNWFKQVPGIGQGRARRIEQWLDFHADTLPRIDRQSPMWNRQRFSHVTKNKAPTSSIVVTMDAQTGHIVPNTTRSGLAPLENLVVQDLLNGSNGTFRSPNANQLGARTDLDAIKIYLSSFVAAGKHKAFEAYRREIERFYLWCLNIAGTPLSSTTLAHAQKYQLFLQNIPPDWINPRPIERANPSWRPFRGQLTPKNQNYALGVLKQFFRKLIENGYLTSSPFSSIQKTAAVNTGFSIDTTRSFNKTEMALIKEVLSKLPDLDSPDPLKAAKARRIQLVMEIALTTGMRRTEISTASLKNLSRTQVKGMAEDVFTLRIVGKGKKQRIATLSAGTVAHLLRHHEDFRTLRGDNPALLLDLDRSQPLILALEAPVSTSEYVIPSASLSGSGFYRVIKQFYRQLAKEAKDPAIALRIAKATPHWTRHTFAHAILDNNHKGKGLPLTQRLLGHASLSTTGQYTEQDSTELIQASLRASPF